MKTQRQRALIRKIENILFYPLKKRNWDYWKNYKENKIVLNDFLNDTSKTVILSKSMPFYGTLFQRPQHLAVQLSKLGVNYLYGELKNTNTTLINKNLLVTDYNLALKMTDNLKNKPYLLVTSTVGYSLKELLKLKEKGYKFIYEYIDEMSEEIQDTKSGLEIFNNLEKLEPTLLLASSQKLYDELKTRFVEDKLLLNKNAVCLEDFENISNCVPDDFQKIVYANKPIIGYYGAIASWLDYDLINHLTLSRPDYNFVFIGGDINKASENLLIRENVFWLGQKEYSVLPNYSSRFDVAMIPFKNGQIAKSTSPLKLFEYMALKKPVVCTKDLSECYGYSNVLISQDTNEFVKNLDDAVNLSKNESLKAQLYEYAKQNTWTKRAKDIVLKLK